MTLEIPLRHRVHLSSLDILFVLPTIGLKTSIFRSLSGKVSDFPAASGRKLNVRYTRDDKKENPHYTIITMHFDRCGGVILLF